jgi:hypothetical protein
MECQCSTGYSVEVVPFQQVHIHSVTQQTNNTMFSAARSRSLVVASRHLLRRGMAEMPVPQSSKAVVFAGHPMNEGWERTMIWWYSSSFILICMVLGTTPVTDIEVWAKQEAAARLKLAEEGKTDFVFGTHYQDQVSKGNRSTWDQFSLKALRMNDDMDDDEEEEDEEQEDKEQVEDDDDDE